MPVSRQVIGDTDIRLGRDKGVNVDRTRLITNVLTFTQFETALGCAGAVLYQRAVRLTQ